MQRLSVDRGDELNRHRLEGRGIDVVFIVGGKRFSAHRLIVSLYSPYLRTITAQDNFFVESNSQEITLCDVDARYFDLILEYIYTGKILITDSNAMGLIEICQYLQLEDLHLREKCVDFLAKKTSDCSVQEFLQIWEVAMRHDLEVLSENVMAALEHRLDDFLTSEDFLWSLGYEEIRQILQREGICVRNEKTLFDALVKWALNSVEEEEDDLQSRDLALDIIYRTELSVLPSSYVQSKLARLLGTSGAWRIRAGSAPTRNCKTCVYAFPYVRDGSEILGIQEFVNQRREEPLYAFFHTGAADIQVNMIPSLTANKSYFQHYGPHSTVDFSMLSTETDLITFGGIKKSSRETSITKEIKLFNFETCCWQHPGGNLPKDVIEFGVIAMQDSIFVIGGLSDNYSRSGVRICHMNRHFSVSKEMYRINTNEIQKRGGNNVWKSCASLREDRTFFSVAAIDENIFIIGNDFCDLYDSKQNTWTVLANVPSGFGQKPGVAVIGGTLFVVGNRSNERLNVCYSFNSITSTWAPIPSLKMRLDVISAFSHNNLLYLLGWQTSYDNVIHSFNPVTQEWTLVAKNLKGTFKPGVLIRRQRLKTNLLFTSTE